MNANITTNQTFSLDQFVNSARDAIVAGGALKSAGACLSAQVWARTKAERNALCVTGMREQFSVWLASQSKPVQRACKDWRKSSPLATRLSECSKVISFCDANPEQAASVYACDALTAALKIVRAADKAAKASAEPTEPEADEADTGEIAAKPLSEFLAIVSDYVRETPPELRAEIIKAIHAAAKAGAK